MSYNDSPFTSENIIRNYQLLSSEDPDQRDKANTFLLNIANHDETWITCQNMIKLSQDPNFIFLGAQLFYQKIQKDLHQFDSSFKLQLKDFLFEQLDSERHNKTFVIDKLASSAALVSCSLYLNQWPSLMEDLTNFMKKSSHHLICGLIFLQRIPQQLRMTNRIAQGIKTKIQGQFLQNQLLFSAIFDSVFDLKDQECIKRTLKTLQSWIRICFPLMKYPHLVTKVLQNSLQSIQKLQMGVKVISQALKLASEQKMSGLSQINPLKQQETYNSEQICSLKLIITFVIENKSNFLNQANFQPQYAEMYLQLVQQLPLSYGFLILENIGFQLISIILELTNSQDLKLSFSTFQFWMDYSEKVIKMKLKPQIKQKIWNIFERLFDIFTNKLLIRNQTFMLEADLKDDETLDDAEGMTFSEYRKQASALLKFIYDFFVKMKKDKGAQVYFKKVCTMLQTDNPPLNKYSQLALFVLKSPLQSMINTYETLNIINILEYLITKINAQNILQIPIPPIVLGETMNFIRDCTRQIKEKDQLFLEALKFVLNYINDEKLCHHAAYCFQILMETINTLSDPSIAESLIHFYSDKKFTKQVVLEKILEGIFNAIIKVSDTAKVESYLDAILNTLFKKYVSCSKAICLDVDNRSDLYLSLVQIKTVLDSYDSSNSSFKKLYKEKFIILANKSIQIVNQILPLGIQSRLRFSSINEVGLSISIYRVGLKILQIPENFQTPNGSVPSYVTAMQTVFRILNEKDINQYYYTITLLSQTLIQFINHPTSHMDVWLSSHLPYFCSFFVQYYQHIQKVDTDVIKMFFTVLESLLLYNSVILHSYQDKQPILNMTLHALRHLNERNMQRKIVSFLLLSLQNQIYPPTTYESIVQNTFASIPIIHSMCYTNLAKVFKHLFRNTNLEAKQNIFLSLLTQNPYHEINSNLKGLLSKAVSFALMMEEQRHIKSIFMQLNQIVWKKVGSDTMMQLQLKLATWKRQYKKSLQAKEHNVEHL